MTLLEAELEKARKDLAAMQLLVTKTIGLEDDESMERQVKVDGKGKGKAVARDDDTHYFHSYEENGEDCPCPPSRDIFSLIRH